MAKNSYSLANSQKGQAELNAIFEYVKAAAADFPADLDYLFQIANRDRSLFPGINITGEPSEAQYLRHWIKGYADAYRSFPSTRTATPKGSCSDPAIRTIVQAAKGLSLEATEIQESHHNLFMSAENIQGNLLEEFISGEVRAYGWIWCIGNVIRAVDFCNTDGSVLLQIKNKSNTENSSSSAIRDGTSIEKWFRLGTRTVRGQREPRFMWDGINRIISEKRTQGFDLPPCNMNEERYQCFLSRVTAINQNIVSEL